MVCLKFTKGKVGDFPRQCARSRVQKTHKKRKPAEKQNAKKPTDKHLQEKEPAYSITVSLV